MARVTERATHLILGWSPCLVQRLQLWVMWMKELEGFGNRGHGRRRSPDQRPQSLESWTVQLGVRFLLAGIEQGGGGRTSRAYLQSLYQHLKLILELNVFVGLVSVSSCMTPRSKSTYEVLSVLVYIVGLGRIVFARLVARFLRIL